MTEAMVFGKLPCHGDFVTRGMSSDEQQFWDSGLSASMALARGRYGVEFEKLYSCAAPWRFVVKVRDTWIAGSLAPSADRGGRLFPVFAARRVLRPAAGKLFAAACESLLFEAIPGGWDADALTGRVLELTFDPDADGPDASTGWWLDGHELLAKPVAPLLEILPSNLLCEILAAAEQVT